MGKNTVHRSSLFYSQGIIHVCYFKLYLRIVAHRSEETRLEHALRKRFSHTIISLSPEMKQTYTATSKPKLYAKCQYLRVDNLVILKQWWRVCSSRFQQMKTNYYFFWRLSKGRSLFDQ